MADKALEYAHEARTLLESPMLQAAFARIERDAIEKMLDQSVSDDDRRRLADRVNVVREVRRNLQMVIDGSAEKPAALKLP